MPGLVADAFGLHAHGFLLGITNIFACIGCAVGPVVTGHLFDLQGNYTVAIGVFAVMALSRSLLALGVRAAERSTGSRNG